MFAPAVPRSVRVAEAPSHGLPVDRLRPALGRRRGLLEGGDGACRAFLSARASAAASRCWSAARARPELAHVPVEQIHPNPRQPRRRFEPEATAGWPSRSARKGILQPVVVRPRAAGGYELIAGERRWRAAREAGWRRCPRSCARRTTGIALLLGLVENVAREQLSPVEEARAYALLVDEFELSLGEIAERVGRSKPTVSNRVRLLELPDDVLSMVDRGELTEGHARAVLAVPGNEGRRRLARKIVRQGLSVRAAERAARWSGAKVKRRRQAPADPELAERVRRAAERPTGFSARVSARGLEIPVESEVQLEELAEAFERALPVSNGDPAALEH